MKDRILNVLMLAAVVLAQLPGGLRKNKLHSS